ncbi:aminodeoxychorismate lyase [Acidothermaceae bacterium B102]|nr:aminodeoxychorismate lyase [Acidothermaceae bacterium B102]
MKVWLDGQLLETKHAAISVTDHGLTVGDGVFETAALRCGVPFALTRHLERLARSAERLGLVPPPIDDLRLAVAELLAAEGGALAGGPARLRITLTGGPAPYGSERGEEGPTVLVTVAPGKVWPATCDVAVVPWTRNENAPTAGAKTTSYADNVVALAEAHRRGAAEAIFANTRGELCEGTGSNVFVGIGGLLYTPPLSSGCLAGITRELLLEWTDAREKTLSVEALSRADEAFLASSTRDVQPIRMVDGVVLPAVPGPLTQAAAAEFAKRAADRLDP